MKTKRLTGALLFVMGISGCASTDRQSPPIFPNQEAHQESRIVFPAQVRGFPRGEVRRYDAAGTDMGVGYDLADQTNQVAITVYVYPGPKLVSIGSPNDVIATARKHLTDGHFKAVKREIVKYHPTASESSDRESSMSFRGQSLYGRIATFKAEEVFARRDQRIVTVVEVYAYGKWIIKFRCTYPEATEKLGEDAVQIFKREFIRQNETAPNQSVDHYGSPAADGG